MWRPEGKGVRRPEGKGGDREQSKDRVLETESRAGWTRGDGVGDLFLICFLGVRTVVCAAIMRAN